MGKLQIGFIILIIAIIEINSIKTFGELKSNIQAFQAKQNKKVDTSIKLSKTKTIKTDEKDENDEVLSLEEASNYSENSSEDEIQPCSCGIFLNGQIKNKSTPKGLPVLVSELDVVFPCTPLGIKQCQTKCVEAIIKHIPKSNDILCATIDKDIYKEKAFLFVQNCDTTWHNTKLSAGKEFCCKDNLPYKCPLF